MPQVQSLDDLIAKKAIEYADQIKAAAAMADKEEEIRIESEKQLAFIQKEAGIKLEGKHEFTVASGRVDSVYSRVIIEYKNPKNPGDRIGPKADSPGSKKVVEQIKKRFYDMQHEHGQPLNSLFGVGLDGNYFIFVRFRDEKWQVQEPVEVNRVSAERFLWALFNLGTKGKAFSPEYLTGDFGSEGGNTIAISGIHALYDAIMTTDNPKAQIFFSQWKILFGEVCGYDVDSQSKKLRKLAEFYQVGVKDPKPAELLFAVHTYYALFMKLLAAEIVAFFHKLPTPLQKMMQATTSNKLKREMEDLEAGSIFRHLNITNFLEGDLFAWYTNVWTESIEKLVREMVTRLDDYNPGTLSEDPTGSRDLLKKLYQQLFPKSVRHDLGEYYTPDWLAQHVLSEIGYAGDPDKRLLDPACGSGTFLVMAINQIKKWYDENRERCRFDESDLCRKILANVVGFDLNPLAVMAARTNYLIAIRGLLGHVEKVEIPVYLCDSIITPSEYGGLFAGKLGVAKEIKTAPATFIIPTEIASNGDDVAKYAEQLEFCVRNGYSSEEFLQRCRDEGLPISEQRLHVELYDELTKLDKANKNGVWARIIKNAFAPLFINPSDYVVGNPPWINLDALPRAYRDQFISINQGVYGLFPHKGLKARHGSSETDISTLFLYVSMDKYLKESGRLGFVITQSVFLSDAGKGFRKFRLPDGKPISIRRVDDLTTIKVFEGAANRTATVIAERDSETTYPVKYIRWSLAKDPKLHSPIPDILNLDEFLPSCQLSYTKARPISRDPTSPWIVAQAGEIRSLGKSIGPSSYKAHVGIHTGGANAVYWIEILGLPKPGMVLVRNVIAGAKKAVPVSTVGVEDRFVYPYLRGRDVHRWISEPSLYILAPQDPGRPHLGLKENELRRGYPKTYEYFANHKQFLEDRVHFKKYLEPAGAAFYSLYDIKAYTYAPYKVVWRYIASEMTCAVISSVRDTYFGEKLVLPDNKLIIVSLDNAEEAHYLCALLNSLISRVIVSRYVVGTQIAPHVLENIAIPRYVVANSTHKALAEASLTCHIEAIKGNLQKVLKTEGEIDHLAAKLWGIPIRELEQFAQSLGMQI